MMVTMLFLTIFFVAMITFLHKQYSIVRYYIKYFIFVIISATFASVPIPLMLFRPRDPRNALIPTSGLGIGCRLTGTTITLEGRENIIKNSGCVVLINHQSVLDLVVLAKLWPVMDNCRVISNKKILYIPLFGTAAWLWGTILIDKANRGNAQTTVSKTGEIMRSRKARVLIFPEGERNYSDKLLLPFKKGAFHLALASKCPIQPVVTNKYRWLGHHKFDDGHVRVKILPAIFTEEYTLENMNELIEKTYNIMLEHINLLTNEEDEKLKKFQ